MEEPSRIPLIIGITGHREIPPDDQPRLENQIRDYLSKLQDEYPHTPLLLLSSLGEGADRLAAKVAVEMDGVELRAVLPWPDNVCAADVHRSGNRDEFDQLLGEKKHRICLKLPEALSESELSASEELKEDRYAEVSRYVTRHSQVMLAVWNGIESELSHTCKVMRWHREGTSAPFAAETGNLDEPEIGSLIHIPVCKADGSGKISATASKTDLDETYADGFYEVAANIERFNRDVAKYGGKLSAGITKAKSYVFPAGKQPDLPPHLSFALDRHAMADQLALRFQKWSHGILFAVLALIFLTISCFEFYAHLLPHRWDLLLAYPLMFLLGYLFLKVAKSRRINNRYIDYRALSEAMRIHFFWKMAGLPEAAADFYLRSYRSKLDWIRVALRSWAVQSGEHDCGCALAVTGEETEADRNAASLKALQRVRKHWMEDQRDYFMKSAGPKNHKLAERCEKWAFGLLLVSVAITFAQVIRLIIAAANHEHLGYDHLTHYVIVAIAMCGVLAGLCHEYMEKRLFEKQARSYEWMASLYGTALKRFNGFLEKGDHENARKLIHELGREALAENAGWVIYHRENEPAMKGH